MHTFDPLCVFSSNLPGFDTTTLNGMILYYRLMTNWSGLGDNTELSRMGLSHLGVRARDWYGAQARHAAVAPRVQLEFGLRKGMTVRTHLSVTQS
jgi:hypothetical protein